jgi:hypothetical protein
MQRTLGFGLLVLSFAAHAQSDVITRAMHDEMQRSMQKLQLEQLDKPYFISYRIVDSESKEVEATLGSVVVSSENHSRYLVVNVRVGDYQLDSSNFLSLPVGGTGVARMLAGMVQLPLDDNYDELRRQIWLATDGAYKKALEDYSGKRAQLQNSSRVENIPDFSKAVPVTSTDSAPRIHVNLQNATQLVRAASRTFRQDAAIQASLAQFLSDDSSEQYLNSEGTAFTRTLPRVSLRITASTQAPDGMALSDLLVVYGYAMKDLPSESALLSRVRDLQERLTKLRNAPVEERYHGPVLFEGRAAAEVFARHFADQLTARPNVIASNAQLLQALRAQQPNSLLDRIDSPVLPDFLSVVDDPTAAHVGDDLLFGGYKVDEEGTPSKKTLVVQHGVLKTVLTSRSPVRGVLESTGNLREQGVAPSNLFVTADRAATIAELYKKLLDAAKSEGNSYGIVIRELEGRPGTVAYRVYPDGHEELIRNPDISGMAAGFRHILAASDHAVVFTEPATARNPSPFLISAASRAPLTSYVVPSLLFGEITIARPQGDIPKPPVISSPLQQTQ